MKEFALGARKRSCLQPKENIFGKRVAVWSDPFLTSRRCGGVCCRWKEGKRGDPQKKEKPVEALQRAVANYSHCFTVFSFIMDTDLGDSLDEGSSTNTTGMVGDVSAG